MLSRLEGERNAASEAMEFERAAAIHQRMQKVQGVAHLASEAVHPLAELERHPGAAVGRARPCRALFPAPRGVEWALALFHCGHAPANERSGSSSLFAQPFAMEPVPLEGVAALPPKDVLESRLEEALGALAQSAPKSVSSQTLSDHMALFTQWFYRPAVRSTGEMIFAGVNGEVPRKALLRAISRVAARANSASPEELAKPPIQWHA